MTNQFVTDYLLVAMNDEETYQELMSKKHLDIPTLSKELETEWEELLEQVLDLVEKEISSTAKDFLSQILGNQGSLSFDRIAQAVKSD